MLRKQGLNALRSRDSALWKLDLFERSEEYKVLVPYSTLKCCMLIYWEVGSREGIIRFLEDEGMHETWIVPACLSLKRREELSIRPLPSPFWQYTILFPAL